MNRRARGFTLVELMVSITIGLVVLSAALTFFSGNLRANTTTLELSRLNQELQTVMTMIARDIRRAGYRGDALANRDIGDKSFMFLPGTVDGAGAWTAQHLGTLKSGGSHASGGPYQCIVLMADLNEDGLVTTATEISGYQLDGTVIDKGRWNNIAPTCGNATAWEALTSNDIEITELQFVLDPPLQAATNRLVQSVEVTLSGRVADKPTLSLTLRQRVRLRNNSY
ncbi:prepilin-type N-terminal cleavage/methylation domain-containing protein [Ferrimonas balearica]|uniref:prepilin-type N-terminal cleavage/methylation domain-containing protein n=1 Tax=Ferrimonas balearica TaxID=44012 RepID=UPI001C9945CB|nr:prepilin-type N-terminal cleavage/methylation domain-containing protein [Ferrimonas balearica]MBY5922807.1 prepilin-type N-terminal cleavage/methylation domain-containing protein [Ferrimonas balearica]MBY5997816.1 prepilin-type N-terminal cleavage/methylation domain-containing protein [Ferrimonas balearica]